jgi:CO/xanthine dehydrogenase FAD-binding subunit
MSAEHSRIFFPATPTELWTAWQQYPDAPVFSGGTSFLRGEQFSDFRLPSALVSLEHIDELRRITRTERYLEAGALVTLGELLTLGKVVPEAIRACVQNTANRNCRSLITLGGSLCNRHRVTDLAATMNAIDARYELKTRETARWVGAAQFVVNSLEKPQPALLTRVRFPLDDWNFSRFRVFQVKKPRNRGASSRFTMVFLAKIEKNLLSDIHVVWTDGESLLRNRPAENFLSEKSLPLDKKAEGEFLALWKTFLAEDAHTDEFERLVLLNYLHSVMIDLTE